MPWLLIIAEHDISLPRLSNRLPVLGYDSTACTSFLDQVQGTVPRSGSGIGYAQRKQSLDRSKRMCLVGLFDRYWHPGHPISSAMQLQAWLSHCFDEVLLLAAGVLCNHSGSGGLLAGPDRFPR